MGAECMGLEICNVQDYSTARGAAGALFYIIDKVNMLNLHIAASDFCNRNRELKCLKE